MNRRPRRDTGTQVRAITWCIVGFTAVYFLTQAYARWRGWN